MSREKIIAKWEQLSARDRDAWIAEVVFGHSIGRERRINGEVFVIDARATHGFQRAVPRYTTDISAAWTLVDKSGEVGGMDVSFTCSRNGARRYAVETYAGGHTFVVASGPTAPEAIGLASIIASLLSDGTDAKLTEVPASA